MCGRFTLIDPEFGIKLFLPLDYEVEMPTWRPRYNLAPTQPIAALALTEGRLKLRTFRWGARGKYPMINLRSEELLAKPGLASSLRDRRCVVVGDGFYEWKKVGKRKIPLRIRPESEGMLLFAGLWYRWKDESGEPYEWATLLTQAPTPMISAIHDRMPVLLSREDACDWLDPTLSSPEKAIGLVKRHETPGLKFEEVSTRVNRPENDDPSVLVLGESDQSEAAVQTARPRKAQSSQ